MKWLEDFLHSLRQRYYKRLGYQYDGSKRMWFKTRSDCCSALVTQYVAGYDKKTKKPSTFRWRCDNCNKQCQPIMETKT